MAIGFLAFKSSVSTGLFETGRLPWKEAFSFSDRVPSNAFNAADESKQGGGLD